MYLEIYETSTNKIDYNSPDNNLIELQQEFEFRNISIYIYVLIIVICILTYFRMFMRR